MSHLDNFILFFFKAFRLCVNKAEDIDVLKYLLENKGDIGVKDKGGRTILHFAASSNFVETVQYLVEEMKAGIDCVMLIKIHRRNL